VPALCPRQLWIHATSLGSEYKYGHKEIVSLLLEHCADPTIVSRLKETSIQLAERFCNHDSGTIFKLLSQNQNKQLRQEEIEAIKKKEAKKKKEQMRKQMSRKYWGAVARKRKRYY
jgi:hypothetical protein